MASQNIFTHLLMIVFTAGSHPVGLQNDIQKAQKKPVIKSEKIIYYDITASKNERRYDFGKDLFLEYNNNGELLKESIILVDEETEKETTNLAYQNQYKTGKLTGAESYSVLRGGAKKETIRFTYNANGKLEKEVHDAVKDGKVVLNKDCFYISYTYGEKETEDHFRFNENTKKFEISFRTVKEFDSRKNMVKSTDYNEENKPYRTNSKNYNDQNQLIRESIVDEYTDIDESLVYNKEGDVVKITTKTGGEKVYTYKYDQYQNWIEKTEKYTEVDKGKSAIVYNNLIKRTVVYY